MIYFVKSLRTCAHKGCKKKVLVMDKRRSIGYCAAHAPEEWLHLAEENRARLFPDGNDETK